MKKRRYALSLIFLVTLVPSLLVAQDASWATQIINGTRAVVAIFMYPLAGIALLVFFWGLIKFIAGAGDDKNIQQGKMMMVWGTVGIFVLFSVWGLVGLLQTWTGIQGQAPPQPPQTRYQF